MIRIIDSGLKSIIVDSGRKGAQSAGFCQSGPMDDNAFWWGNYLVGNTPSSPQLEVIGVAILEFTQASVVAITGRGVNIKHNGKSVDAWQPIKVYRNDTLEFYTTPLGARSYIAVSGEWKVPLAIGSACTVTRERLGGLLGNGSPLKPNDAIEISPLSTTNKSNATTKGQVPDYSLVTPIDVVLGYQYKAFSRVNQQTFFSNKYTVTNKIDRMGYRLSGEPVVSSLTTLRSEGVNLGDIQLPPDGQPIVLMRDRQTLGGYPKIGSVATYDIGRLAQAVPGETVTFRPIDMNNARAKHFLHLAKRQTLIGETGCL